MLVFEPYMNIPRWLAVALVTVIGTLAVIVVISDLNRVSNREVLESNDLLAIKSRLLRVARLHEAMVSRHAEELANEKALAAKDMLEVVSSVTNLLERVEQQYSETEAAHKIIDEYIEECQKSNTLFETGTVVRIFKEHELEVTIVPEDNRQMIKVKVLRTPRELASATK